MGNMRSFLKYSLLGLCGVGVVLAAYPFVASMNPSYEANVNVPLFKTNWIGVGNKKHPI
ncbi:MAG: hypothetical protein HC808_02890 [Candidatus Competibacteraceae bacterium]|nr:hypothetical protein [Candidatus Competibacteraceae bacterium]